MKDIVLITGGNGCIAKQLAKILSNEYYVRFLTRNKQEENEFEWNVEENYIDKKSLENVKHIIHLSGSNIAKKRWNPKRKKNMYSSRIDSAKLILKNLKKEKRKIHSFISASAIGYYGTTTTDNAIKETAKKGNDFLSNLCDDWEKAADKFTTEKIARRTVKLRFGVVLSKQSVALQKIITPIKFYLGSALGNGKQFMPWIHIDDLCGIIRYTIENDKMKDTYNAVAPEHITNYKFTKTIAQILKKPIFLPNIPSFIIKLIFGERACILLNGSQVSSKKIQKYGYQFKYLKLDTALKELLN